jgi:hypothetical protein
MAARLSAVQTAKPTILRKVRYPIKTYGILSPFAFYSNGFGSKRQEYLIRKKRKKSD